MSTTRTFVTLTVSAVLLLALPTITMETFGAFAPPSDASAPTKGTSTKAQKATEDRATKEAARERAKWNLKLDKADRAECDKGLNFVAPAIPDSCERLSGAPATISELRGKVVVFQTFNAKSAAGMNALKKTAQALDEARLTDVVLIGVQIPEGADIAKKLLERASVKTPVLLDAAGEYCNALGAFKSPVNFIIDRQGDMKSAGLTPEGVVGISKELLAKAFEETVPPTDRPKLTETAIDFPTFNNRFDGAADLRGKEGPAFKVDRWWNGEPDPSNKLIVLDFWATWCPPCRAAIPHMNELAKGYPNDVCCVGVTNESSSAFDKGVMKESLSKSKFSYAVALAPGQEMYNFFSVRSIPHCVIMSTDGVVRWQGHPMELDDQAVSRLVTANRLLVAKTTLSTPAMSGRWKQKPTA
ncbi:MAG: redoxin domain-containing protein [Phycisphaerales bacterium]|nr:redoxin domain-containing protein [Phycisphaerales bacterium]